MKRSEMRQLLIDRTVEYCKDSPYARDYSFVPDMAEFGVGQTIIHADSEAQHEALKTYWLSLAQRGKSAIANAICKRVLARRQHA